MTAPRMVDGLDSSPLIPAVELGTNKCVRCGEVLTSEEGLRSHQCPVSPAPAAPGVDFEKAMEELETVVWAFHAKEHKADFRALVTRIREGHRALVDAAVKAERERLVCGFEGIKARDYAPLLALVEEWQAAEKMAPTNGYHRTERRKAAAAALAAWRKS